MQIIKPVCRQAGVSNLPAGRQVNQMNYFMIFATFGSPQTSLVLRLLFAKILIPEATNRKPSLLTAAVPVNNAIEVIQEAAPGIECIVLRRTPPVTELANVVE